MSGSHRARKDAPRALSIFLVSLLVIAVIGALGAWGYVGLARRAEALLTVAPTPPALTPATSASPIRPRDRVGASQATNLERKGSLVIHATGDVSLDPNWNTTFKTEGYEFAWSGLEGLFARDDLTIVNMECPVTNEGSAVTKEFTFRCDPKALGAARKAGVEVANLGNNHSQDFGKEAMLDSRQNLIDARIAPVGAGKDAAEANEPALFDIKGWKVAVLGFGGVLPSDSWLATKNTPGMANGDDIGSMTKAIKAAKKQADIVLVMIHWGVELDTQPTPEDVKRAYAMIDAGADAIFGGHSHRLQPMETYEGKPIFYSLGNFVWPNNSVEGATTAVAEVTIRPNGLVRGRMLPAFITAPGHPELRGRSEEKNR